MFALRICRPPSWMRERVRSRIKSRPSDTALTGYRIISEIHSKLIVSL